jgi:hypothetical protein
MLDYETYCKIRDHFDRQRLTCVFRTIVTADSV